MRTTPVILLIICFLSENCCDASNLECKKTLSKAYVLIETQVEPKVEGCIIELSNGQPDKFCHRAAESVAEAVSELLVAAHAFYPGKVEKSALTETSRAVLGICHSTEAHSCLKSVDSFAKVLFKAAPH